MPQPRLEPRLVFALVLAAFVVLWVIGQLILVSGDDDCSEPGGLLQLFVPGSGCPVDPPQPEPTGP